MENSEAVKEFVLSRPLVRPKTSIFRAVKYVILFLLSVAVISSAFYALCSLLGAFAYLPEGVRSFMTEHPIWHKVLYALVWYTLSFLCVIREAGIGAIRLYQRYAPEHVRERCLCVPSCSEYSILCLQKYCFIHALCKIYKRLFKTCGPMDYIVDWP